MGRKWTIWIAAGMLVLGLAVLLYPSVSSAVNRQHGSYAIQQFQRQLDSMDEANMKSALEEARAYNSQLKNGVPDEDGYEHILDFGNGIMGYITIEKIDLMLPIYHGVSTQVLEKGIGHLPSSALPVGGEGNHTVLTGHTGLPSAKLFTDLVKLTEGDEFQVTVGNQSASYQVDQILVVLPQETEELLPDPEADYCTLVTCTPYGVNSHRLFVRGSRVEKVETETVEMLEETASDERFELLWLAALPCIGLLLIWKRKKGRRG